MLTIPVASQIDPNASQIDPNASQIDPNASQIDPNASQIDPNASQIDPSCLPDRSNWSPSQHSINKTIRISHMMGSDCMNRILKYGIVIFQWFRKYLVQMNKKNLVW